MNCSKEIAKNVIDKYIKNLLSTYITNKTLNKDLPHIGTLIIKNNIACIKFKEDLIRDTTLNYFDDIANDK